MDKTLQSALEMGEMGFAVHFLRPRSKIPLMTGWSDMPILSPAELEACYQPGCNVGFRPGKWSTVDGSEIVVLDVDVKGNAEDAAAAYAAVDAMFGQPASYTVRTGSPYGRHAYLRMRPGQSPTSAATTLATAKEWVDVGGKRRQGPSPSFKPAWTIELLSTGKQVVAPPSIHPDTGRPYIWTQE